MARKATMDQVVRDAMQAASPARVTQFTDSLGADAVLAQLMPTWSGGGGGGPAGLTDAIASACATLTQFGTGAAGFEPSGLLRCPETQRLFFACDANLVGFDAGSTTDGGNDAPAKSAGDAPATLTFRSPWGSGTAAATWTVPFRGSATAADAAATPADPANPLPSAEDVGYFVDAWASKVRRRVKGAASAAREANASTLGSSPTPSGSSASAFPPASPMTAAGAAGSDASAAAAPQYHPTPSAGLLKLEANVNALFAEYARCHLAPLAAPNGTPAAAASDDDAGACGDECVQTSAFVVDVTPKSFTLDVRLRRGDPRGLMLPDNIAGNGAKQTGTASATPASPPTTCWLSRHRITVRQGDYAGHYSLRGSVAARLPLKFPPASHADPTAAPAAAAANRADATASPRADGAPARGPRGTFFFQQRCALEETAELTATTDHAAAAGALVAQAELQWHDTVTGVSFARPAGVFSGRLRTAPPVAPLDRGPVLARAADGDAASSPVATAAAAKVASANANAGVVDVTGVGSIIATHSEGDSSSADAHSALADDDDANDGAGATIRQVIRPRINFAELRGLAAKHQASTMAAAANQAGGVAGGEAASRVLEAAGTLATAATTGSRQQSTANASAASPSPARTASMAGSPGLSTAASGKGWSRLKNRVSTGSMVAPK